MGTVVRRGKKWRAVVRKRGHRTRTKTFVRRTHAERWVRETEVEIEKHGLTGQHHDLGALMKRYIDEIGAIKEWTRTHRSNLTRFKRDMDGFTLADLTPQWMVNYAQGRGVAPATISQEITYLSTMLRTAEAMWDVSVDWVAFRKGRQLLRQLRLSGKSRERDRRPEGDELDRIKAQLRSELPVADILDFAIITAMRISEVTRLQWSDLDERRKMVLVRDRKHPTDKAGNDQWVPLLGDAMVIVKRQPEIDDRIFPYNPRSVTAAYRRARTRAGVDGLRFHDMRHDGISRLFERGYGVHEVALVSGHRSWQQLKRYTNLKPESLHAKDVPSTDS